MTCTTFCFLAPIVHSDALAPNPICIPLRSQGALCAGDLALLACNSGRSLANSNSKSLEGTLCAVVVVITVQAVDVKSHTRALRKALQAVGDHLAAELAEPLALEAKVNNTVGSVGKIDDGAGQGFVKRSVGVTETSETGGSSESLGEGVAKGDANIFGSVVVVN